MRHMEILDMLCSHKLRHYDPDSGSTISDLIDSLPVEATALPGVRAETTWLLRRSYVSLLAGLPDGTYVFVRDLEYISDILLEEYTAREICSNLYLWLSYEEYDKEKEIMRSKGGREEGRGVGIEVKEIWL